MTRTGTFTIAAVAFLCSGQLAASYIRVSMLMS
jgi:hypothetical protein